MGWTRSLGLVGVVMFALGTGSPQAAEAGTRIEAEGTLVSLPAGKSRRVGIRGEDGTVVWLARPTRDNYLVRQAFHRIRRLPMGAYVKLSGALLSADPLRMGPTTIKSGKQQTLTLEVSKDGKSATWAGQPLRLHALSSIPDNSPSGTQTTGQGALLKLIQGKRVVVRGFSFSSKAGLPTDVFLDEVQAVASKPTHLVAGRRPGEPEKQLLGIVPGTPVWVSGVKSPYGTGRLETVDQRGNSTSHGGWFRLSDLTFARPKPTASKDASESEAPRGRTEGVRGKVSGLLD